MKRRALSFVLALVLVLALLVPMATAEGTANVKFGNVQGGASQLVDVNVSMASALDVTIARLAIKYDSRLELVSITNGTVFENTYTTVNGEENGEILYVGDIEISSTKESVSAAANAVICTLKFKIPDNAIEGEVYNITLDALNSEFATSQNETIVKTPASATTGTVTASALTPCATHSFEDSVVVRERDYFQGGFSYKTCSSCGYVASESTSPIETNLFTPVGTAIRYAGNPSGIGAHFKVNAESLQALESKGYKIEIGIELVYGKDKKTEIFYGDSAPEKNRTNYADGVISASIEGIKTQLKGNIYAYVKIIGEDGSARMEKTYTSINGSKDVSIADVAGLLNFNKYTQASKDYLNAVANGFEN